MHVDPYFISDLSRILAIDFGTKRTGIAVTDPQQLIATPLITVHSSELLPFLKEYLKREAVETIVIGEPRHLDGTTSGPQEALANFVRSLEKAFPVVKVARVDERFTSKMAFDTLIAAGAGKKQRRNKEAVDTISAVLILQSYMEQQAFRK